MVCISLRAISTSYHLPPVSERMCSLSTWICICICIGTWARLTCCESCPVTWHWRQTAGWPLPLYCLVKFWRISHFLLFSVLWPVLVSIRDGLVGEQHNPGRVSHQPGGVLLPVSEAAGGGEGDGWQGPPEGGAWWGPVRQTEAVGGLSPGGEAGQWGGRDGLRHGGSSHLPRRDTEGPRHLRHRHRTLWWVQ